MMMEWAFRGPPRVRPCAGPPDSPPGSRANIARQLASLRQARGLPYQRGGSALGRDSTAGPIRTWKIGKIVQ